MVLCDVYIKQPKSVGGVDMAEPYLEHTALFFYAKSRVQQLIRSDRSIVTVATCKTLRTYPCYP